MRSTLCVDHMLHAMASRALHILIEPTHYTYAAGSACDAVANLEVPLGGGRILRLIEGPAAPPKMALLGAHTAFQTDEVRAELLNWVWCAGCGQQDVWRTSYLHGDNKLENWLVDVERSSSVQAYQARGERLTMLKLADMGSALRSRDIRTTRFGARTPVHCWCCRPKRAATTPVITATPGKARCGRSAASLSSS